MLCDASDECSGHAQRTPREGSAAVTMTCTRFRRLVTLLIAVLFGTVCK
jgi:hypothetical protein